ncbi:hypothetical protein C8A01DRAFT_17694 [Parachaetomium inaequale]|uniref:Uncharacterized protein n=1 Tax=Parachaetomium inaequale TaxID=2588326 RepID=A0AAN6PC06_9PEZI|nr:hypothetical protein C8A01DRAFT_17694 [Parachaetomium inaequale]
MVHLSVRSRYRLMLLAVATLLICALLPDAWLSSSATSLIQWTNDNPFSGRISRWMAQNWPSVQAQVPLEFTDWGRDLSVWENPDVIPREKVYKPPPKPVLPVADPFPLLSQNPPPGPSLLRAPKANRPPRRHYPEQTPLFVGFTRNWPQLLQCVVSYIAAGWPPEDIHVVENTGVMHANREGKLTLQNPFYLNHTQLAMLGVDVITTPTLLTFAQLQNFYLWTALDRAQPHYFWTHQDLVVFSHENLTTPGGASSSLYTNAVTTLRHLTTSSPPKKWAHHFFAYDHLTLVNRDAVLSIGGWDTHIPFYASDCDAYLRLLWAGFSQTESKIGIILDVGSVMADVGALLRIPGVRARLPGDRIVQKEGDGGYTETWERLVALGERMQRAKYVEGNALRNTWQVKQKGGQGEPFYRDADGFETGVKMMIDVGRSVFAEKWGHRGCDLVRTGARGEDAWRLERDWDEETEGLGFEGESW